MSNHALARGGPLRLLTVAVALLTVAAAGLAGPASSAVSAGGPAGAQGERRAASHGPGDGESGEHIVWSQFVDLGFSAARIMVSDAHGHHERPLTHPGPGVVDINPEISPDGRRVAFERDLPDISHIIIINLNGQPHPRVLRGCTGLCVGDGLPSWTLDGRHLLVARAFGPIVNDTVAQGRLWRIDLAGKHPVSVSNPNIDGKFEDSNAASAPGGYIIVVRFRLATDQEAIFRMNDDGSHACRLTPWALQADTPDISPATTGPTKDLAVFETFGHNGPPPGAASAVATVKATCGGPHPIHYLTSPKSSPTQHFNPGWSPDGTHVVFVRFKSVDGDPIVHGDLVTSRADGTHREVIANSPLFDFRPDWGAASR